MDQEKIGNALKKLRIDSGLTQKEMGDIFNITYQAVSKWENGYTIPDIMLLKEISVYFDVDMNALLVGVIKPKKSTLKKVLLIIFSVVLVVLISIIIFFATRKNDFEFRTLNSMCESFNITGSIAYSKAKSSIYVSEINYCGTEKLEKYKMFDCKLYEMHDNDKKVIGEFKYNEDKAITLEEFLKDTKFYIDNYESNCNLYKEEDLHIEITATNDNEVIKTYKIPLTLKSSCTK